MKILCISDARDALIYSAHIKNRFSDIDLVLGAGDLDLDYYGFIVSSLNKPLLFVFGNHNLNKIHYYRKEYADSFDSEVAIVPGDLPSAGSTYVGGKVVRVRGLIIAGLGGSMRYNDGQNQFTETGMFLFSLRLFPKLLYHRIVHGRFLDILLTHASPRGIHDQPDLPHRGFRVFLWFMRTFKPRYLVHGHIHLYDINASRVTRYRDTTVINAYEHYVFDTENGNE
ncbi:MAG TPA: metallophosphoesterase [Spirochaetia bacterium]|nr:metallophosphoesterase [Spirochaetia bacterium]